ncbi:MAG: ABC transporter permease [Pirellulaceae bacterium]
MSFPNECLLFGDIFNSLRLQLSDGMVNWLTPLWILCLGGLAGLVLCAALWGLLRLVSAIPGIGTMTESPRPRWIAIGVLTAAIFAASLVLIPSLTDVGGATANQAAANQPAAAANVPAADTSGLLDTLWAMAGTLLASWLLATAVVTLMSRAALAETGIAIREGVLWPLFITAAVMSVLAVLGLFVVREPVEMLDSLARLPVLATEGAIVRTYEVAGAPNAFDEPPEVELPVSFRRTEISELSIQTDQKVRIRTDPFSEQSQVAVTLEVTPGEPQTWRRASQGSNPFRDDDVTKLYAKNLGNSPAQVKLTARRAVAHPQMKLVPIVALAMAGVFFVYLFQRAATPKLAAVALSTAKSEIAQPLYAIIMAIGIFALILFIYIPYFTLSSDIKMLKDSGLTLILVLSIIQAVWAASSSVADEVEGKTALTVLSKPVSRRSFILGKFTGIGWSVGLMIVMLGLLLLITVAYKPVYDSREGNYKIQSDPNQVQTQTEPTWQNCYAEMVQVVPGLVLVFLEMLVMTSLSVAISTRLPTLANFIISFTVYVLGHLTPLMVQSQVVAEQLPPVVFFGRLIATVLPVLDHFNIQASVAAGVNVPPTYLAWALVYCVLYSSVAMLLALTLFEDRDLA